ncbi:MAG: GspE/PulE family protein, partial [Acidobacteriota bacterium]
MERFIGYARVLALLIALAGAWALVVVHEPTSSGAMLDAVVAHGRAALAAPALWIALGAAIFLTLLAQGVEHWAHRQPIPDPHYVLSGETTVPQRRGHAPGPIPAILDDHTPHEPHAVRNAGAAGAELRIEAEPTPTAVPLYQHSDMVILVDRLLRDASTRGASDIHVLPLDLESRISFRVHGDLQPVMRIPHAHHEALARRIKVMARLVVYRADQPQDGHFNLETASGPVDVRVSLLPTQHGEKVVMRLAHTAAGIRALDQIGMPDALMGTLLRLLERPEGLILLTGPTGSGKTTTIYAALQHIHRSRGGNVSIASIEDPVEIELPFLSQTQVQAETGFDFAKGLRGLLRQDPNVMMVGEIRDPETAQIAIRAGMTGHLILTTLHAESTSGVFNRLIDMGGEPFLVASAVQACLSQRLVRRLCPDCRTAGEPAPAAVVEQLRTRGLDDVASLRFQHSRGCDSCNHTGFRGRTSVFELLVVTSRLREAVTQRLPTYRLADMAREEGMVSLLDAAIARAAAGDIALDDA